MQFQAELHLYDSYNESLRQVMNVEKCLYNTKCEMQEQKNSQKVDEKNEEIVQIVGDCAAAAIDNDTVEKSKKLIISRVTYKYIEVALAFGAVLCGHLPGDAYLFRLNLAITNYK